MIAEQKAALALQYTVAVRDRFVQSYQTIMNMQI
jgi:flagellar hook-basal body complex protein FliE